MSHLTTRSDFCVHAKRNVMMDKGTLLMTPTVQFSSFPSLQPSEQIELNKGHACSSKRLIPLQEQERVREGIINQDEAEVVDFGESRCCLFAKDDATLCAFALRQKVKHQHGGLERA